MVLVTSESVKINVICITFISTKVQLCWKPREM